MRYVQSRRDRGASVSSEALSGQLESRDGQLQDVTNGIFTINGSYPVTDSSQAWLDIECPCCRKPKMLVVARQEPSILLKGTAVGLGDREIEPGVVTNRWL